MAGSNSGFDSAAFRTAIRSVYEMAASPTASDQVKFYFDSRLVFDTTALDASGVPFDPSAAVTRVQKAPVSVPCSLDYGNGTMEMTAFGETVPRRVLITVLDEDYVKIKDCSYIAMHGIKYRYVKLDDEPSGLFDVGLYTLAFEAEGTA